MANFTSSHQAKDFINGLAAKCDGAIDFGKQDDNILALSIRNRVALALHVGELHWNLNDSWYLKDLHCVCGQVEGYMTPRVLKPSWLSRGRSCQPTGGPENSSSTECLLLR